MTPHRITAYDIDTERMVESRNIDDADWPAVAAIANILPFDPEGIYAHLVDAEQVEAIFELIGGEARVDGRDYFIEPAAAE